MKERVAIPGMRFIRWFFIITILLSILLWSILFVIFTFFSEELTIDDSQNGVLTEDLSADATTSLSDKYPDVVDFVNNYFDQIQRGNYSELKENYWNDDVTGQIEQSCSSPLNDIGDGDIEKTWRKCGFFNGVNVELIEINEKVDGYHSTIQFFDDNQEIIGIELHPEWSRGHEILIVPISDSLKTSNWEFFK